MILCNNLIATLIFFLASNAFLNKYSEINYDRHQLHQSHQRVRRALENHVKLSFNSHGRYEIKTKNSQFMLNFINKRLISKRVQFKIATDV